MTWWNYIKNEVDSRSEENQDRIMVRFWWLNFHLENVVSSFGYAINNPTLNAEVGLMDGPGSLKDAILVPDRERVRSMYYRGDSVPRNQTNFIYRIFKSGWFCNKKSHFQEWLDCALSSEEHFSDFRTTDPIPVSWSQVTKPDTVSVRRGPIQELFAPNHHPTRLARRSVEVDVRLIRFIRRINDVLHFEG